MQNKEKIKRIKGIMYRMGKKFVSMPAESVDKYNKKDLKKLMDNFQLYAGALIKIELLIRGKKEIWANCPYCGLKFTKIVKDTETKRSFWCETCNKLTKI